MRHVVGSAIASITLVAAIAPAFADDLADARRFEAALEYDQALTAVDRALAHGGADPARLVELHLLAGKLAAGLDHPAIAVDHFARALAIRPSAALPDGASPKLTVPFADAREHTVALAIAATLVRGLATVTGTSNGINADPLGLVVGIAVHVVDLAGRHDDIVARTATRVVVPPGVTAIEIAALDASGNRVWVGPAPRVVEVVTPPPPVQSPSPFVRWPTWAIATAAFAAVGGVCAWRANTLQDEWDQLRSDDGQHDYSELTAVETRGRRFAIAADISFGLAAAAAITGAIFLARGHAEPAVAVTVGPSSIGVAARF